MKKSWVKMQTKTLLMLFCALFVTACAWFVINEQSPQPTTSRPFIQAVPIFPVNRLEDLRDGVFQLTVPLSTTGYPLTLIQYQTPGSATDITSTETIFPTDVYIAVQPGSAVPKVFLGRSPQSGCPVKWRWTTKIFKTYCDGSEFRLDGSYLSGPSPRNLDEFPVSIREGMIWITNTVTLGRPSVGIPTN